MDEKTLEQAARIVAEADAIFIGAGAGMGVDSGLPDFRGSEGFWRAYPRFKKLGLRFEELANPRWFRDDPGQAWGFYGHRYNSYVQTQPHQGFQYLRQWLADKPGQGFVFTSNVDGQFQKAGFEDLQIAECHGSIHHLQCSELCHEAIWSADIAGLQLDEERLYAVSGLPICPRCGAVARPNILMFGDSHWIPARSDQQLRCLHSWLSDLNPARLVVIELGAGLAIPTVRYQCEALGGQLLRINPRDCEVPAGGLALEAGALAALSAINRLLSNI